MQHHLGTIKLFIKGWLFMIQRKTVATYASRGIRRASIVARWNWGSQHESWVSFFFFGRGPPHSRAHRALTHSLRKLCWPIWVV